MHMQQMATRVPKMVKKTMLQTKETIVATTPKKASKSSSISGLEGDPGAVKEQREP